MKTRPMVDETVLCGLRNQDAATVHEAMGRTGAMDHTIRPLSPEMKLCGRALTVKCQPGDNLMLIKAVSMAQPDDVIVADMGHLTDNGPFGEVLAVNAQTRGVSGLVLSCGVRDTQALCNMGMPVFSSGVSVFGTVKASCGTINHPVTVGGLTVNPGDIVLADRDGVVVIPFARAEQALRDAEARKVKEEGVMERLRAGEELFDIYNYQKTFDALGITVEE